MNSHSHFLQLRFCAYAGPVFIAIFLIFWAWMGQFLPPLPGDVPTEIVASYFRDNANMVRLAMSVSMTFAILYLIWALAISRVMDYCLKENDSILSRLQIWGAAFTIVSIIGFSGIILGAAYRPDAVDDTILQLFYDFAWVFIDLNFFPTTVQMCVMGIAFLADPRTPKLIPKWLAWYGIWVGLMFFAELLMPFFKSGAFGRAGILNYWIEFGIWYIWCIVLSIYIIKAVQRLESEPLQTHNS